MAEVTTKIKDLMTVLIESLKGRCRAYYFKLGNSVGEF